MPDTDSSYRDARNTAETLYASIKQIHCPYFPTEGVVFNADGFHHLQNKPNRAPRTLEAQLRKFRLLPWAIAVIKKSGTLQEYRTDLLRVGHRGADGFQPTKQVQFFSFAAIVGEGYKTRILVVVRRVGNGQLHFWSVMHDVKPGKNGQRPRLMPTGREEE